MAPQIIHLPDGQNFTVTPVFAGLFFKSHELNTHPNAFPIGWTIVLHTEDDEDDHKQPPPPAPRAADDDNNSDGDHGGGGVTLDVRPKEKASSKIKRPHIHSFTKPTLQNDSLFISSISNPSSADFKPAASPTRQIAMMLWVTLYWYFHQPAPSTVLASEASKHVPDTGKPRGEWQINIRRDGVLRGRNLIPKLERMGLIASLDSAVGVVAEDTSDEWAHMFVSRRMFWQIPGRLFLFTLQPNTKGVHSYPGSPISSRPGSPVRNEAASGNQQVAVGPVHLAADATPGTNTPPPPITLTSMPSFPIGPYFSASHLPTYYPPTTLLYTFTNHIRHPVRPKPPRMGEVFYTRFVPSVGQYLSFRVASSSNSPVPYFGPASNPGAAPENAHLETLSDTSLLQMWLSNPRVSKFWGGYTPNFLTAALSARHSFPVIGLWDGVPFGYFEIYWVKEDPLGQHMGGANAHDWDRGFHVLVGEEWARGRVQAWLGGLAHWMFCVDYRTMSVCAEPRIDNVTFIQHLHDGGFLREKEITFPHKQAALVRLRRESWEGPAL